MAIRLKGSKELLLILMHEGLLVTHKHIERNPDSQSSWLEDEEDIEDIVCPINVTICFQCRNMTSNFLQYLRS